MCHNMPVLPPLTLRRGRKDETRMGIIEKIAEYTRLCREYSELPLNAESPDDYKPIEKRRKKIKQRIGELRKEIGMEKMI